MLKILIIEDEALIADQLEAIVISAGHDVVNIVDEAAEAFSSLSKETIDLVLLDINLNDDFDGIDIAHRINSDFGVPFMFISSQTDPKTLRRMSMTKPISFITKPFQKESVYAALEIVKEQVNTEPIVENDNDNTDVFIKNGHVWERLNRTEICYVEAQDSYIAIHTVNGRKMVLMSMKSFQEQLNPAHFIRVHRSYLVNKKSIEVIGTNFIVVNGKEIPVSSSGKKELLEKMEDRFLKS